MVGENPCWKALNSSGSCFVMETVFLALKGMSACRLARSKVVPRANVLIVKGVFFILFRENRGRYDVRSQDY